VVVVADRAPRAVGAALLAGLLGLGLWHFDAGPTNRSDGPGWAAALERAEAECRRTGAEEIKVGIAPDSWDVEIACADLTDG